MEKAYLVKKDGKIWYPKGSWKAKRIYRTIAHAKAAITSSGPYVSYKDPLREKKMNDYKSHFKILELEENGKTYTTKLKKYVKVGRKSKIK